jgi:hypothetical protein
MYRRTIFLFLIFLSFGFIKILPKNQNKTNTKLGHQYCSVEQDTTAEEIEYYYPAYYYITINSGYSAKDNRKLSNNSERFYLNINYRISNFIMPLDMYPTQVGFYNELGINNTSLYLNLGPEARINHNFYFIPYAGISIIPFSKYDNEDLSFIYYLGLSAGYFFRLNYQSEINFEVASDLIKLKENNVNIYFKIGITFDLLYSL